jgi:hypothetical protein
MTPEQRRLFAEKLIAHAPKEKEGVTMDYLGLYILLGGVVVVALILTLPTIIRDRRESRHP